MKIAVIRRIGEVALFSLAVGAVNMLFPRDPGFFAGVFNPYLFLALLVAAYYGKYYGLASLALSCLVVALPLPAVLQLRRPEIWQLSYWRQLGRMAPVPVALTLAGVWVFGLVRDAGASRLQRTRERLKSFSRRAADLLRQKKALETVNRELERRISRQQESVTALHGEIQQLFSLNLGGALEALLETVCRFSGATAASVWEYRPEGKELALSTAVGERRNLPAAIPVEGTIEGWVVRNSMIFSVKMLVQYENLRKMDSGRNLLTLPLHAGRRIWGVLNIADMPFVRYNLYTEKLVAMIVALTAPALEKALEYESVMRQAEVNPHTGLPGFSQFYSLLVSTLARVREAQGTASVIVLELANFERLQEEHGRERVVGLLGSLSAEMESLARGQASFFHYKSENQLAILFPNLDYDGASLFSLEALGAVNDRQWLLEQQPVHLEVILGYASLGEKEAGPEDLLQTAEHILEMQKL